MIIDHFAYLVRDTDRSIAAFSHLPVEIVVYRHALASQKAFITMLRTSDQAPLIELVEPYATNKTMQARLQREQAQSVLYHIGYTVADFDARFTDMRAKGWLPLTMPFEGMQSGCRASHLYHPDLGVVEIMEQAA